MKDLPKAVMESEVQIMPGLTIKVVMLEDGKRIIPEEDFKRALEFLGVTPQEFCQLMAGDNHG